MAVALQTGLFLFLVTTALKGKYGCSEDRQTDRERERGREGEGSIDVDDDDSVCVCVCVCVEVCVKVRELQSLILFFSFLHPQRIFLWP